MNLLIYLSLFVYSSQAFVTEPVTVVKNGALKGSRMVSLAQRPFYAFRGIPYGKAPTGPLRFQDPVPADPWQGILDVSAEGPRCLQYDDRLELFQGAEDCLRLNVYTHSLSSDASLRPVMVWIHGGSWVTGSGNGETDIYGPHYLLDRDVVLVTINYRLSSLGFLSTEDKNAPGNYGLLDQVLALKWVQENIIFFGGDPNSVTLFGQSAGAGSVHSHILSPRSKGLFQRAIAESGNALCPWSIVKSVGFYTKLLAKHLKCPTEPSSELLDCLRKQDPLELVRFRKMIEITEASPVTFGPRVDNERAEPFFPQKPADILRSGQFNHVPLITGVTQNEAAFAVAKFASQGQEQLNAFRQNPTLIIKNVFGVQFDSDSTEKSARMFQHYIANETRLNLNKLEQMFSDGLFFKCTRDTINLHLQYSSAPLYTYYYTHRGIYTYPMLFQIDQADGNDTVDFGVSHGDELFLIFSIPFLPPLFLEGDLMVRNILLDLWTSFARNGTPVISNSSVDWWPTESNEKRYLLINANQTGVVTSEYPFMNRLSVWDTFFDS